jgi:branched-subunit amino acid permease
VQEDLSRNRLSRPQAILFTLALSFAMSLLGFKSICQILGTILEWIYPLLIAFAITQIVRKFVVEKKLVQLQ